MKIEFLTVKEWKARISSESYYSVARHLGMNQGTVKNADVNAWRIGIIDGVANVARPSGVGA